MLSWMRNALPRRLFILGGLVAVFATQTSEAYNAFKGTPIEATATTHLHAVTRHLDRFERGMIYPRETGCELTEN